jgi:hypothetical protein
VASVPVRRDNFVPGKITFSTPTLTVAERTIEDSVAGPEVVPENTGIEYWNACVEWSKTIENGTSVLDIPDDVIEVINKRYKGDKYKREYNVLSMISWMYEHLRNSGVYTSDKQALYYKLLSEIFLEIIWDESLSYKEQSGIIKSSKTPILNTVSVEQTVKKGSTEAFRYINTDTGIIQYECNSAPCSEAVTRLFESDSTDPYNSLQVNKLTTGPLYGFIIPKLKESKFVLKTSDRVVDPGQPLEKGKECENISNMTDHKIQLKQIRDMIVALGYPPFLIIDSVLNEKEERSVKRELLKKKKKESEMTAEEHEIVKMKDKLVDSFRKFQNVVKACTLKNITLRLIDKLEKLRGGKRYFYRPISAVKSKHKLK